MSDQSPPLPPAKKSRVLKVAHDITEPVSVPVVPEPVSVPVVPEPVVPEPVPVVPEPVSVSEPVLVPVVPEPVPVPVAVPEVPDFDREVEMWRGIELPSTVSKTEEKEDDMPPVTKPHDMPPLEDCGEEDDMPPLIPVTKPHEMPSLEDCGEDDMPALDNGELDENNQADDEAEAEDENEEQPPVEQEPPLEDCQFLHDKSTTIDGELESFSQRIYTAFQNVNNVLIALATGTALGFILVNAFSNKSINNLNEL